MTQTTNQVNSLEQDGANVVFLHGRSRAHDNGPAARLARRVAAFKHESSRVVESWLVGSEGNRIMLMLSDGLGHYTQSVDTDVFAAWLSSNHPAIFDGQTSLLAFDFHSLPAPVLDGALAHCRSKRAAEAGVVIAKLVSPVSPFMLHYAEAGWGAPVGGQRW